ncbi:hypothetical protein DFP73DRAFT_636568 [Morchella snyderi]|nr:hypothetical protein DFP73DRAFT_636568 [Morchella snyderi]
MLPPRRRKSTRQIIEEAKLRIGASSDNELALYKVSLDCQLSKYTTLEPPRTYESIIESLEPLDADDEVCLINETPLALYPAEQEVDLAEFALDPFEWPLTPPEHVMDPKNCKVNLFEWPLTPPEYAVDPPGWPLAPPEQAVDTAEQAVDTAEQAVDTAEQAVDTAEQAVDTAEQAVDTAEQALGPPKQAKNLDVQEEEEFVVFGCRFV